MEVVSGNLHKSGQQHYHVMLGEEKLPSHNTSYDSFDEAVDVFLQLVESYYPGFFEHVGEQDEVRTTLMQKAIESTPEEQHAKVLVSIGTFKIGFTDCYGCLFPWHN